MYPHHRVKMVVVTAIGLVVGCGSGSPDGAAGSSDTGRVKLALRTNVGTVAYELRDAIFDITGPIGMALSSEDAPDASVIEQPLPIGDYLVTLAPDWTLYSVDSDQSTEVEAMLVT
jgi:hypothetical protein